jgi:hypothetical protein
LQQVRYERGQEMRIRWEPAMTGNSIQFFGTTLSMPLGPGDLTMSVRDEEENATLNKSNLVETADVFRDRSRKGRRP